MFKNLLLRKHVADFLLHACMAIGADFVRVQPGFLQLLLTQT